MERIIRLFDPDYGRWKICPDCGTRIYDSKYNVICQPCWEGPPKKPTQEDMNRAVYIFGRDQWEKAISEGKCPITIIESGGDVGYASSICEKCAKSFRPWRSRNLVYEDKFIDVCKDCMN